MNDTTIKPDPVALLRLIEQGDWDLALDSGLMEITFDDKVIESSQLDPSAVNQMISLQNQFRCAWAARDRFRRRSARLSGARKSKDAARQFEQNNDHSAVLSSLAEKLLAQAQAEVE